jgi:hypothetical protein
LGRITVKNVCEAVEGKKHAFYIEVGERHFGNGTVHKSLNCFHGWWSKIKYSLGIIFSVGDLLVRVFALYV